MLFKLAQVRRKVWLLPWKPQQHFWKHFLSLRKGECLLWFKKKLKMKRNPKIYLWSKRKDFANKKIFMFKRSLWFCESENLAACWIGTHKNKPDRPQCVQFRNCAKSLHPKILIYCTYIYKRHLSVNSPPLPPWGQPLRFSHDFPLNVPFFRLIFRSIYIYSIYSYRFKTKTFFNSRH